MKEPNFITELEPLTDEDYEMIEAYSKVRRDLHKRCYSRGAKLNSVVQEALRLLYKCGPIPGKGAESLRDKPNESNKPGTGVVIHGVEVFYAGGPNGAASDKGYW